MKKLILAALLSLLTSSAKAETINITLFDSCFGEKCYETSESMVEGVETFWAEHGIKVKIKQKKIQLEEDYSFYVVNSHDQKDRNLRSSAKLVKEYLLPNHGEDITWFSTNLISSYDNKDYKFLGYGLHDIGFMITTHEVLSYVSEERAIKLFNHELAHALGLEHVDDHDNLMYPHNVEEGNNRLTEEQLKEVEQWDQ